MGWAFLPPIQRTLDDPITPITRPTDFPSELPAWRSPAFTSSLSHARGRHDARRHRRRRRRRAGRPTAHGRAGPPELTLLPPPRPTALQRSTPGGRRHTGRRPARGRAAPAAGGRRPRRARDSRPSHSPDPSDHRVVGRYAPRAPVGGRRSPRRCSEPPRAGPVADDTPSSRRRPDFRHRPASARRRAAADCRPPRLTRPRRPRTCSAPPRHRSRPDLIGPADRSRCAASAPTGPGSASARRWWPPQRPPCLRRRRRTSSAPPRPRSGSHPGG